VKDGTGIQHFIESNLKEFDFVIGDEVEIIGDRHDGNIGLIGKITKDDGTRCANWVVEFTDESYMYKDGSNLKLLFHNPNKPEESTPPCWTNNPEAEYTAVPHVSLDPQTLTSDPVSHPSHYTQGAIETIDFIKAKMSHEQFEGYLLGNVIKYLTRYNPKGNAVQDLEKATTYLKWLTEHIKGE
jgi:hypothetical protein